MLDFQKAIESGHPPAAFELDALRNSIEQKRETLQKKRHFIATVARACLLIGLLAGAIAWGAMPAAAYETAAFWSGVFVLSLPVVVRSTESIVEVLACAISAWSVVIVGIALAWPMYDRMGPVLASLPMAVYMVGAILLQDWIVFGAEETTQSLGRELAMLDELDVGTSPKQCIALDEWRLEDEHIDSYLKAVARQGRKPIMAEWGAAKRWIKANMGQAKAACERFAKCAEGQA